MAPMMLTSVVALGLAVHPAFPGGRPALQPRATFLQPKLARHVAPSAQAVAETDADTSPGIPYSSLTVGVVKESTPMEARVVQAPGSVATLVKAGFNVVVESGAGAAALFTGDAYVEVGAKIASSTAEVWKSDCVPRYVGRASSASNQRHRLGRADA